MSSYHNIWQYFFKKIIFDIVGHSIHMCNDPIQLICSIADKISAIILRWKKHGCSRQAEA